MAGNYFLCLLGGPTLFVLLAFTVFVILTFVLYLFIVVSWKKGKEGRGGKGEGVDLEIGGREKERKKTQDVEQEIRK